MKTSTFRKVLASGSSPRTPESDRLVAFANLPHYGIRYTRVHLRRLIARKLFPPPLQISPNRVAWRESDLNAWIASRPAQPLPQDDQVPA